VLLDVELAFFVVLDGSVQDGRVLVQYVVELVLCVVGAVLWKLGESVYFLDDFEGLDIVQHLAV